MPAASLSRPQSGFAVWAVAAITSASMLAVGILAGYLLLDPGAGQQGGEGLSPSEAAAPTQFIHIAPWDDVRGEPAESVVLAEEASGTCFGSSNLLQRFDAWRCVTSDGEIEDPCFASGLEPVLLCSTDGSAPESMLRLALLEPLPELDFQPEPTPDGSYAGALVLVLADGQRCGVVGGATTVVAGQRYSFHCPHGRLYGDPDTSSPVWTISYRAEGAGVLTPVDIATVYQ